MQETIAKINLHNIRAKIGLDPTWHDKLVDKTCHCLKTAISFYKCDPAWENMAYGHIKFDCSI